MKDLPYRPHRHHFSCSPLAAIAIALFALPPLSWAASDTDGALMTASDLLDPVPRVHSATRLSQKVSDAPVALTVIDRELIQASGAVEIVDLLRLVPGFQAYHVHANKFAVTSHGQGDQHPGRLEVMVDGRSVYLPLLSTVDWVALGITLEDIDRIEVVRGSNVPTYGSNAFLGAINIITREPLQDAGTRLTTTQGSLTTRRYSLHHNDRLGSLDYRISADTRNNHGHGIGFVDGIEGNQPALMEDGGEISQFNFRATYTPSLRDSIDIQLGYSSGQIGVGNATDPAEFNPRDLDSHYQHLAWRRQSGDGDSYRLHFYHNYLKYRETNFFEVPENAAAFILGDPAFAHPAFSIDIGQETGTNERYDLEFENTLNLTADKRFLWGAGLRRERLQSSALLARSDTLDETLYRSFANLEWAPAQDWIVNLGAMLEHADFSATRLSPRLGVNHHLQPNHTLRLSLSQAFRTPSLLEQNERIEVNLLDEPPLNGATFDLQSVSNGRLDPERVRSYELGYLWQQPRLSSLLDLKVFLEEVDNAIADFRTDLAPGIELDPTDQKVFETRNTAQWRTKGAELQWQLQPVSHTRLHLAYAYADAEGEHDRGLRGILRLNERTPQHSLSLLGSHRLPGNWQASWVFYRQTAIDWFKGSKVGAHNRLDVRLAKALRLGRSRADLEMIVQNLLAPYTEFEDNNRFDTRAFVRLRLHYL